jgi:WD40 repeat protein
MRIRHSALTRHWIVGCADGQVLLLDETSLKVVSRVRVPGELWDLDVVRTSVSGTDDTVLVVVANNTPRLQSYEIVARPNEAVLVSRGGFRLPPGPQTVDGIYSVKFGPAGTAVYGVDGLGRLFAWDRQSDQLRWTTRVWGSNPRTTQAREEQARKRGWPFPRPMRRGVMLEVASSVAGSAEGSSSPAAASADSSVSKDLPQRLVVGTVFGNLMMWDEQPRAGRTRFQAKLEPRLCFDQQRSWLLWCLAKNGSLQVFDSLSGRQLAETQGHEQGGHAITSAAQGRFVMTVGEDGALHSWRMSEAGRIETASFERRHSGPLLSIAVSPDDRWVAAVDVKSELLVWDRTQTTPVFRDRITDDASRPLTGKLAFNARGTRLAAFGAGQSGAVYTVAPFRRVPDVSPKLSGRGGTSLAWDDSEPGRLIATDDVLRFDQLDLESGRHSGVMSEGDSISAAATVASVSPNGRRHFFLEASGRMLVYAPRQKRVLWQFETDAVAASDLAMDSTGRRLAVAQRDGQIEVLETLPAEDRSPGLFPDLPPAAKSTPLARHSGGAFTISARSVALNDEDRVVALAVQEDGNQRSLWFVEEGSSQSREEPIETFGAGQLHETALICPRGGQPMAVYRFNRPDYKQRGLPYAADLRLAHRVRPGVWQKTDLLTEENAGAYPVVWTAAGEVHTVFHFSFDGYYLKRTTRADSGWHTEKVGRQRNGFAATPVSDGHCFLFRDQDATFSGYLAFWNGHMLRTEVPCPQGLAVEDGTVLPDGTPVVLHRSLPGTQPGDGFLAFRIAADQWRNEPLPTGRFVESLASDRSGRLLILRWHLSEQQLVLWRLEAGQWTAIARTPFAPPAPSVATILIDSHGTPIVVVTNGDNLRTLILRPTLE